MLIIELLFELLMLGVLLLMLGALLLVGESLCCVGRYVGGWLCPVRTNTWGISCSREENPIANSKGTITGCSLAEHRQRMLELENFSKGESQ